MSNLRIWHPSRDAYHCAFRMLRLLIASGRRIELERLRILDMYLLFPPLLHRTSMTREIKSQFTELGIEKPDRMFIRLPSNAAVFQELLLYQNSAIGQLAARGLFSSSDLKKGAAVLEERALPSVLRDRVVRKNSSENGLVEFLVGAFSALPLRGVESVYRRAGLPTRVVAE
jgi:hypothetical protein